MRILTYKECNTTSGGYYNHDMDMTYYHLLSAEQQKEFIIVNLIVYGGFLGMAAGGYGFYALVSLVTSSQIIIAGTTALGTLLGGAFMGVGSNWAAQQLRS